MFLLANVTKKRQRWNERGGEEKRERSGAASDDGEAIEVNLLFIFIIYKKNSIKEKFLCTQ